MKSNSSSSVSPREILEEKGKRMARFPSQSGKNTAFLLSLARRPAYPGDGSPSRHA